MHDEVHPVDRVVHHRPVENRVDVDVELRVVPDFLEVLQPAGGKIVHHIDFAALLEEPLDEMGADESGPPGYKDRVAHCPQRWTASDRLQRLRQRPSDSSDIRSR